ncbi:MAG: competence/damage-inducible protein A, partial [Verrucomicrobiae bacterium]|nr:competence/damage-inducible protein A [Verrucomicrobiae bacterium]
MAIEIINTGSELMIGRVLNTHHQWLCAQLDELGYTVHRQVSVSDESSAIVDAVQESLGRSNAVILTGGLGPTSDDLTRGLIAKLFHRRTLVHEPTLERIRNYFQSRGREIPFKCEIQAQYP